MAEYVFVAAIDAVLNGVEVQLPGTYVALQDYATGFDGPGSYHIQLHASAGIGGGGGYRVTYGLPPSETFAAMTVCRVVLTSSLQQIRSDARKLNVGNTGVNATIAQNEFPDGSYLATGCVTTRTLATGGGFTPTLAHGTSFPIAPLAYQMFYRDDLEALFIWNGSIWESSDSLAQLNDVDISSPTNGQVLTYDASSSKWVNGAGGGGGGGGGTAVSFSATATGTNWRPQGGSTVASSYFKSTASITLPGAPTFIRLKALVQVDASATDSYFGVAVSSDGTNFIAADVDTIAGGYCEAYYGTATAAAAGGYYTVFQAGATQLVFVDLTLLVTSSGYVMVAALINNTPVFGAGSFGSKTAFEATTVDLTVPFYVYAIGANVGNMIACAYSTSLF
jgi:hypothetical protein